MQEVDYKVYALLQVVLEFMKIKMMELLIHAIRLIVFHVNDSIVVQFLLFDWTYIESNSCFPSNVTVCYLFGKSLEFISGILKENCKLQIAIKTAIRNIQCENPSNPGFFLLQVQRDLMTDNFAHLLSII